MPQLERLWNELRDKGLHIFHVEMQGHGSAEIEKFCREKGATFPQTTPVSADFGAYECPKQVPYAYVIGVDGKVVWQGKDSYHTVIQDEIAKVRFPGLGRASVAAGLEKSAAHFARKQYAKAATEAEAALEEAQEKGQLDPGFQKDADYIVRRAAAMGDRMLIRADQARADREYSLALAIYRAIAEAFEDHPRGADAAKQLDELESDKMVAKELKALRALDALEVHLKKSDKAVQKETLRAFAAKYEGLKAAEKARAAADAL